MDGELLKSTNGMRYLTDNYTLETGLPRQIIQTSKNITLLSLSIKEQIVTLTEMVSGGSTAMIYAVVGNVALQLFL